MLQNKIVKRLEQKTYCQSAEEWLSQMPFYNRLLFIVVTLWTIFDLIFGDDTNQINMKNVMSCQNIPELLIFWGLIVSKTYPLERKEGSAAFFITALVKYTVVYLISLGINYLTQLIVNQEYFSSPSILFGLLLITEDSFDQTEPTTMLLGLPLQIKKFFYPLFLIIMLLICKMRLDIAFIYLFGIFVATAPQLNNNINAVGRCLQNNLCSCFLSYQCFVKTNTQIIEEKPLQHVVTSNSVVFEDS